MAAGATRSLDVEEGRAALRIWLRLLACTNMIEGRIRGQLRQRFATTLPRFDVLAQLDATARDFGRGLTMSELSRRLMVTNGNLTGLIGRLVKEGLVSRTTLLTDRRTQLVRLTPAGKRAFRKMVPEHRAWIEDTFALLSHQERTRLYELIGKLKDSVQNLPLGEKE